MFNCLARQAKSIEARTIEFLLKWGVGNGVGGGARSQARVDASYFASIAAIMIVPRRSGDVAAPRDLEGLPDAVDAGTRAYAQDAPRTRALSSVQAAERTGCALSLWCHCGPVVVGAAEGATKVATTNLE